MTVEANAWNKNSSAWREFMDSATVTINVTVNHEVSFDVNRGGLFEGLTEVAAAPGDLVIISDASDSDAPKVADVATIGAGKQTIWVPAGAMTPNNSASPPLNSVAIAGSNVVVLQTRDCDATNEEYLYFSVAMPNGWDEGTLSFQLFWSHAATVTNFGVVFNLYANAFSNDDTLAQNAGTPGAVTDTGGTTDDLYISPESAAFTVAGSPAEGDIVLFRLNRVPGNASDTLAVDCRVIGIKLFYTTNANTDV